MANEVSQACTRFGVNPSLVIVSTNDITDDITVAMIAGSRSFAYFGSIRRPPPVASPRRVGFMSSAPSRFGAV
jgi:hypothetical protein